MCSRSSGATEVGDAKISLGGAKSSLGDAKSSLGDAKSSLGDAKSSLGDVQATELRPPRRRRNRCDSLTSLVWR
jgi:hypothetical protein